MNYLVPLRIYRTLETLGNAKASVIAKELGISRQLANYHLAHLLEHKLVEKVGVVFYPILPLHKLIDAIL